jgi:ATP synthase protein I
MAEKKPDFTREVARKAHRKAEARRAKNGDVWFWLGMFGLVGWSVAIPTVIAIVIGLWLDRAFPGPPSWTLSLLIIGVVVGWLNAWYWIKQESRRE